MFWTGNVKLDGIPNKVTVNETFTSVLDCISSFEGTYYEKLQDTVAGSFISCFTSAFTSADIILSYRFLELHLALSVKRFLSLIFLFEKIQPTPPPPLHTYPALTHVNCTKWDLKSGKS